MPLCLGQPLAIGEGAARYAWLTDMIGWPGPARWIVAVSVASLEIKNAPAMIGSGRLGCSGDVVRGRVELPAFLRVPKTGCRKPDPCPVTCRSSRRADD